MNDRLALTLLQQHGPLSRSQLREMTGLAQPTVLELVTRLEDAGWITAIGQSKTPQRGRRPILFQLAHGNAFVVAAQVLADEVTAVAVDVTGARLGEPVRASLDPRGPSDQVAQAVQAAVVAADRSAAPVQIVVGVPSSVNPRTGEVGFMYQRPAWTGNVLGSLRRVLDCPLQLVNGAHLVAAAEGAAGAARGLSNFAVFWIGPGLGLAQVLNGAPFAGVTGSAGQISYLPVAGSPMLPLTPGSERYRGDLLGLLGNPALAALAESHGMIGPDLGAVVRDAYTGGGSATRAFRDELALRVTTGLAAIAAVCDPGHVLLHGQVGLAGGEELARAVTELMSVYSPVPVTVAPGELSDRDLPVLEGALVQALASARDRLWGGGTPAVPGGTTAG